MVVFRMLWIVISLTLLDPVLPAHADFAAGQAAYDRGGFNAAYNEWLPLAEAGDAEAQFRIGRLHDVGEGRKRDGPKAVEWYEKAFEQGSVKAAYNLGYLYHRGKIVIQSYDKARRYYLYGAKMHDGSSQLHLGFLYIGDHGVLKNIIEAYKWFYLAELNGSRNAGNAIREFEKFTNLRERELGRQAHREWLKNHSR
jgi:uncharacterized protein